ncbi:MFS transporter [Sporosarcina obsidiansis]|uniref:MFS transporter n=1 Tax=Sporosarcina obsidiansis TaxID=2660748 RepID=UPI00129A6F99|nr:MFS transporter [Sporosarcina obsidiansis]
MQIAQRKKLYILMVNMFIAVGSFGIIIPILPAYLVSIGQAGTAAGLIIALFAAAQFVMSPIAGRWADRYGRRVMIISGLSGLAISMFVFYFSDSIAVLYLSRVIGGVGAALLIPAIFAYVSDITTMDQRAKGNSMISAAMSLGIVIGPGIGGFLADYGLKVPLLVSALVGVLAVVFSAVYLKESMDTKPEVMMKKESMIMEVRNSFGKPYIIPLVITLVMSFGLMAYESVLGLYIDNSFGATPKDIAIMVTATGIVSVIIQLFAVDWIVRKIGELNVLTGFLAVAAGGFLLSVLAKSYEMFFVVTMIIFLASSILRPVLTTLISKLAGDEQGFAMGMNNSYMSIGNVAGPLLAGVLYDVNHDFPFLLGLAVLALTWIGTMFWRKRTAIKF